MMDLLKLFYKTIKDIQTKHWKSYSLAKNYIK